MSIKFMIFIDSKYYLEFISHANVFYVFNASPLLYVLNIYLLICTADNIHIKLHTIFNGLYVLCDCKAIIKNGNPFSLIIFINNNQPPFSYTPPLHCNTTFPILFNHILLLLFSFYNIIGH